MKVDRMTIDPRTVVSMNAFSNSSYNSVSVVVQNEKHIFPPTQYILYTRAWLISILTLFSKPEPSATHLVCISQARSTVITATSVSYGKNGNLTPYKIETLEQIDTQFVTIDYVHEMNVCSKFVKIRSRGTSGQRDEI